ILRCVVRVKFSSAGTGCTTSGTPPFAAPGLEDQGHGRRSAGLPAHATRSPAAGLGAAGSTVGRSRPAGRRIHSRFESFEWKGIAFRPAMRQARGSLPMNAADAEPVYAHSLADYPLAQWELLDDHAADVARRAEQFAAAFGAQAWGDGLGRWHDLGKRHPDFQRYIRGLLSSGPPHAWVGAMAAAKQGKSGVPVAFAIAGHHCGLADLRPDPTAFETAGGPTALTELLRDRELERA